MGYNWKSLKNAEVFGRGQYLKPGKFRLKLNKMYTIATRKKGNALIVEFEVLESSTEQIPVGGVRNWYQGLADQDVAFPAIKEFLIELFGIDQTDESQVAMFEDGLDELMEECADDIWKTKKPEEHPLHGKTIAVECYMKETNNGRDFTVHNWEAWEA